MPGDHSKGYHDVVIRGRSTKVYCDFDESPAGYHGWTRIFVQRMPRRSDNRCDAQPKYFFENLSRARFFNVENPGANLYSILNDMENFRRNGKLEFKMRWPDDYPNSDFVWRQETNPLEMQTVEGYQEIQIDESLTTRMNKWGGLERTVLFRDREISTLLDGSARSKYYFFSIGQDDPWNGGLTGPHETRPVCAIELWIR